MAVDRASAATANGAEARPGGRAFYLSSCSTCNATLNPEANIFNPFTTEWSDS